LQKLDTGNISEPNQNSNFFNVSDPTLGNAESQVDAIPQLAGPKAN
jgi:hypothetical protein